jgi:hypothetical protein
VRTFSDDLLEGAIDLHAHIFPQVFVEEPGRVLDHEWAISARDCGMRGFAMKSHLWPTMAQARILNSVYSGITAFGGIVLNSNVGGLSPFAAESAVRLGANIIWMPTFSSAHDIKSGGYNTRIAAAYKQKSPGEGIVAFRRGEEILPELDEILEIARDGDAIVATGHFSPEESVVLARRAKELGVKKFVFTHALTPFIDASDAQMLEVADLGYIVEFAWAPVMPLSHGLAPSRIAEAIRKIGPERCIMSSDAQMDWNPKPPEMLRMFIASMMRLGLEAEEVNLMVRRNPARLVGLEG